MEEEEVVRIFNFYYLFIFYFYYWPFTLLINIIIIIVEIIIYITRASIALHSSTNIKKKTQKYKT